jgi:predicted TPR repeat methyltransferase
MEQEPVGARMEEEQVTNREYTFDEALHIGVQMLRMGAFDDAARLYRALNSMSPDDPNVLHYSGVLAHQQGRSDEGLALIKRSLEIAPGQPDCYSNLGIIYQSQSRFEDAIAAYQQAIDLESTHTNAYNNLGVLLRATGRTAEAEAAYRKAIEINPKAIDAYHNLGVLLASTNRTKEAVICYCTVTTLAPRHPDTRRMLALAYCNLGQVDKAIEVYQDWLKDDPDNPVVAHLLAGCTGENVPTRASDEVVKIMFDNFAKSFESKLAHLQYRAPSLVQMTLEGSGRQPAKELDVLDAGCGTGLCGPLVLPYARYLTGIDLSAGMLEQASAKKIYDELEQAELTQYLQARHAAFDVVVSADTLVYFGPLEAVAAAARGALRTGGLFIFTLEELDDSAGMDLRLETHGRYSHNQRYVERVLADAGFTTDIQHAHLRMESGSPVSGLVVRATAAGEGARA